MSVTCTPLTSADGTFSAAGKTAWNAGMSWGGSDASFASGVLTIGGSTNGAGIVVTGGTITASSPLFSGTQTWNNAGVTFIANDVQVTDTASAAGSLAWRIRGGAAGTTELVAVQKDGLLRVGTADVGFYKNAGFTNFIAFKSSTDSFVFGQAQFGLVGNGIITWGNKVNTWSSSTDDTVLNRASAGVLQINAGSGSGFAGRLKLTSTIAAGVAVGSLNASPTIGEVQSVTDALAPAIGSTVASGGSAKALVWWNGANWTVIGV